MSTRIDEDVTRRWDADVVLRDGRPCHLRAITASDAGRLRDFHASLSEQTIYYRFFGPRPSLSDREIERFTVVDHINRVAIIATVSDDIIGVGRYDRLHNDEAEVAFVIRDDHQGRGLGSVLLEHLAAAARENGVTRFVAEVLPENRRMQATFEEAGYRTARHLEDGYISVQFDIEPTARMRQVMVARERAAEARSIRRLLNPASVAVIGASRTEGTPGHEILRHLRDGGFVGSVFAVHTEAETILGYPCLRSITEAPVPVDLAIVAVRAESVLEIVDQCAAVGVRGLVVTSLGFAESGPEGRLRQEALVARARGNGMRVVGPGALGLINTDPRVKLSASLVAQSPERGRLGFFCQSGGLGGVILESMVARRLGISSFVSAGNRADVSGNDLLQYWSEDEATDAVLLYLESVGNPRKFTRLVRRMAKSKPVVAVRSGRSSQAVPRGHSVRVTTLPAAAVDAIFVQSGVIQTTSLRGLLNVAQILASQPLPHSEAVAVVATADSLAVLAEDAVLWSGLSVSPASSRLTVPLDEVALEQALVRAESDPSTGSVLVVHVPPLPGDLDSLRSALHRSVSDFTKPVVVVSLTAAGDRDTHDLLTPWIGAGGESVATPGAIPLFDAVEEAVAAMAAIVGYVNWLSHAPDDAADLSDHDLVLAEERCGQLVGDTVGVTDLDRDAIAEVLTSLGLRREILPTHTPGGLRDEDWRDGVPCRIRIIVDDLFGPVMEFGLAGELPELLGDHGYSTPPLSTMGAAELRSSVAAAPLLDRAHIDGTALDEFLAAVSLLPDVMPRLRELTMIVQCATQGLNIVSASVDLGATVAPDVDAKRVM